jgi:hypothetical protein|tara:strand:+ start:536 stop:955 length:420 start_codon:yes stop_codon:yes gene_type:complete
MSINLVETLLYSIERLGLKKTIKVLQVYQEEDNEIHQKKQAIIKFTCLRFNISEKTLKKGRKNIPQRTEAIGVCCLLLNNMCEFSQKEIALILEKEKTNVNKYIKKYINLDINNKIDKILIDKIEVIINDIHNSLNILK